jgi:hypothetical protein
VYSEYSWAPPIPNATLATASLIGFGFAARLSGNVEISVPGLEGEWSVQHC